jgi:oligo-alginate lyase
MKKTLLFCFVSLLVIRCLAQHPSLMLAAKDVAAVRKGVNEYALLKRSYQSVLNNADKALTTGIKVPTPKDDGGGYTHEQHKKNYGDALVCGIAYQVSQNKKYADHVKNMLLSYADQYQSWPLHPKQKSSNPAGKIFWQNLNDCVWQVYMIQAYDLIYPALTDTERKKIESQLFEPVVDFLMNKNRETFDRIHNHGTWCIAAVGMTGYVLNKKEYAERALLGFNKDRKSGYYAQMDSLFSKDGYYSEGPYYQRYALMPFLMFAKAVYNYDPQLKIFQYRNNLLSKAIHASFNLAYSDGSIFPVNDAMKDKKTSTEELIYGVDLAYADIQPEPELLSIAKQQDRVIVSGAGLAVAKALAEKKEKPYSYPSAWFGDGPNADQGGISVLRSGTNEQQQCVVFKATSQGMGHGHFDRLNMLYYDNGGEVFSDYGAARFLNIESKRGGGYLPENKTWAKQTVAHNTVVVDKTSHYKLNEKDAEDFHPDLLYFNSSPTMKTVSAKEAHAYKGVEMIRTNILFKADANAKDLLIDVYKINSTDAHNYDLPFWYNGHITFTSFPVKFNTKELKPAGTAFGYEHLWLNADAPIANNGTITVLNRNRFYSTSFLADNNMHVQFMTLGANDPENSLRNEKAFILSATDKKQHSFISITESHGGTDPIAETTTSAVTSVSDLQKISDDANKTVFSFRFKQKTYTVTINYNDRQNFIEIK